MTIPKTYRRLNKALRLACSGEAQSILAAAREILATRIRHGDVLGSPGAVRDYLQLILHSREYEVFVVVLGCTEPSARLRGNVQGHIDSDVRVSPGSCEDKREEIAPWMDDDNPRVRAFAAWLTENLDQLIADERQRAEESLALRKHKYGVGKDEA